MKTPALVVIFCLLLSGCKVGPDYTPPPTPVPTVYLEDRPDETEEITDEDLVGWWATFNDPFLDELLNIAIEGNFNYRIALEQVYQARAQYWIQFTQILPELDAAGTASRYRVSRSFSTTPVISPTTGLPLSPLQNFFQVGFDAIWEIDLFGKLRRSAGAAYDLWEASWEEVRGVKITVLSEVVATYGTICAYQEKKYIAQQVVELDQELLDLSRVRFYAGLANEQEADQAQAQLEGDTAQLAIVDATLKQEIYSLAVLLGQLPELLLCSFEEARPIPFSQGKIPVGLPSELLRRRPDIRSVERQLAAATEQIGVSVAELFPSVSLTGSSSSFASNPLQGANVGYSSDNISKLFRPASLIWGIGGFVQAPIFDFGKRLAGVDASVSYRNQVYYAYQQTVIQAFQETEQALATYFDDEVRERSLSRQVEVNWRILELAADQFQAGLVSYSDVLAAREVWLVSLNALADSQQALVTDLVAIYKALGGDW
jgi:NodT family efflux transporter outer membrane factor (OMF) lipoprotein